MSENVIKSCAILRVPPNQEEEAIITAVAENPANTPKPFELAVDQRYFWKPGRVLRVRFMDGIPEIQQKIADVAIEWSKYANIKFDFFNTDADAEVRISFRGPGSWSYLGTQALNVPPDKPTMNFGWLTRHTSDAEYSRVVLHEFGHALGAIHEHQNPGSTIPWDKDAVYAFYMKPPNSWKKERIDHNVLNPANTAVTLHTDFDDKSIMLYPVDNQLTLGDWAIEWQNNTLSPTDKTFIAQIYPFENE